MEGISRLRFLATRSSSFPEEATHLIAEHVAKSLDVAVSVEFGEAQSGPVSIGRDPLSLGEADISILSGTAYVWYSEMTPCPIELVAAAPVFDDPRCENKPSMYADIIASPDSQMHSFADLEGGLWAYNHIGSLAGYYSVLRKLEEMGSPPFFFTQMVESGSHARSIDMVLDGSADAAGIDSHVLAIETDRRPELRELLCTVDSLGPFPIQPLVVRASLDARVKEALPACLLSMGDDPETREAMKRLHLSGFAPPLESDYARDKLLAHYGP